MKFVLPAIVLAAALGRAETPVDVDNLAGVVKSLLPKFKCAIPCVASALNNARCKRPGAPILVTLCDRNNRAAVTRSADTCLERKCHLGGIAPLINIGVGFMCKHPELVAGGGSTNHFQRRDDDQCAQCKQACQDAGCASDESSEGEGDGGDGRGDEGSDNNGGEDNEEDYDASDCGLCTAVCQAVCEVQELE